MSSEIYVDFKVHKINISRAISTSGVSRDLFGTGSNEFGVIVFGKHYSSNCFPQTPSWSVDFLGGNSEFLSSYIDSLVYLFDDGLSQSPFLKNGESAKKLIMKLLKSAQLMSVDDLYATGASGFRFEGYHKSGVKENAEYRYFNGATVMATEINDTATLHSVLDDAIQRKSSVDVINESLRVWANRPHLLLPQYYKKIPSSDPIKIAG